MGLEIGLLKGLGLYTSELGYISVGLWGLGLWVGLLTFKSCL